MKRLVSTFFLLFLALAAVGQIGNEWIQYDQPYVRISVGQDGLFTVSYSSLQQAGFPVTADPGKFQLFHRGREQSIIVQGGSDGVFDPTDFIEFYGRKNDGSLDSTLYEVPANQPHQYYNLYSDATAYFLTIGSSYGKRIPLYSGAAAGLTEKSFVWSEKLLVFKDNYSSGRNYGSIQKTTFDTGEGWMGLQVLHGQERVYTIEGITETFTSLEKPILEVTLTGRGPMFHDVELYVGARLLSRIAFNGFETHKHIQEIEWSDIDAAGKLSVTVRVTGSGGPDRVSASYIRLVFPQKVTMAGATERQLLVEASDDALLKIGNPPAGLRLFDVTDPWAVTRLQGQLTSTMDVVVPRSPVRRTILATTQTTQALAVKHRVFRQISPSAHNYIVVTHPDLRNPAAGYLDPVKAYAEYRSLPEGGGFDTLVVNIDQLYDQFNYGETSPRAIYQFMKFLASGKLPEFLFLIGKGLDVNYGYHRRPADFTTYRDLVPTAGYPASDMAFTTGLGMLPNLNAVATGRLSASSPSEVGAYLNKVKEQEALPFTDLNRKKILHLSGGIEDHEPALFRDILRDYELVAENHYLGARVQAIVKRSTDIKLINIAEEVNGGLALITFFGHSAPGTLDFDIGRVTDPVMGYNNEGKYPFLLMNGCGAGSFFLNTAIMGENWITAPRKGAVGFIAHSSYGLVTGLRQYSSAFYNVAFGDSVFIRKGVGIVQQEVARRYLQDFGFSPLAISQIQQMVLLGDPAARIFGADKPDYSIDAGKIFVSTFTGEPVTAKLDSFRLNIPLKNTGIALDENIRINVTREFNTGHTIEYNSIVPAVLHSDTLSILVRNPDTHGYGINNFTIRIDADDLVEELDETNNAVSFEYFIPLNSTRNLYPYNFSIVKFREITLSFQYTDLLAGSREYLLEVDTTNTFDSGYKQQFTISSEVLGQQAISILDKDSVAYYWRTRIAQSLDNESQTWAGSSFTYMKDGPEGWAQIHFPQFESNPAAGLVKDPELRRIRFEETVSDLALRTFSISANKPQDSISLKINGVEFNLMQEGGACRDNTINLVAFDRRSTQPYAGIYFKWYEPGRPMLCGREPYVINSFKPWELNTGNGNDLNQYIDNIAPGDSVVLFNIGKAGFEEWPPEAKTKLGELGISSQQLSGLRNGDAVIIFGRKALPPGTATVHHAAAPEPSLTVRRTIAGRFTSGTMSSGVIGPAQQWHRFVHNVSDIETDDVFDFTIIGIEVNGNEDTLHADVKQDIDLGSIDAATYPFIKVIFGATDDVNLTSVQLLEWMVFYEPVAEGLVYYRDTREPAVFAEGEDFSRDFGFVNVSDKTFPDSLTVRYNLLNQVAATGDASSIRIAPPAPNDTAFFSVPFKTVGRGGVNDIQVFVNPRVIPERTYDNNLIRLPEIVEVITDKQDPVIDVTFDGRYLQNDEHVSANPSIVIRLWDDNPFMLKTDTTGIRIFLAYPCSTEACVLEPIYFSRKDVSWQAATHTTDFQVNFSPVLESGQYTLKVEATDASGNWSGESPYEIRFRVERENTILVTSAYPNPFFTETSIDIFITGENSVYPSYKFYVTGVDGRVVAGFASDEGLHVGRNKLMWSGAATNGERLPNGLYFYRLVVTSNEGEKAYSGKVVLLR